MRWLLAAAFTLVLAGPTLACGNPLLWAMLFERYPGAKVAYEAELKARAAGLVQARRFGAARGVDYHAWSLRSLSVLADEMTPAVSEWIPEGEVLTVLLADEVAAIRFSGDGGAPKIFPAATLGKIQDVDVITTVNVLHSGWRHSLNYAQMIDNDLVLLAEPSAGDPVSRLFVSFPESSSRP